MYRFITAAALVAAVILPAASVTGHPIEGSVCTPVHTVKDYKRLASRVYKQHHIQAHQRAHLREIAGCQPNPRAYKSVQRWHDIYVQRRKYLFCSNFNPRACIRIAARRYKVGESWLVNCALSEGGLGPHDYKKHNYEHSGAAGNFQFMKGTFDSAIRAMGYSKKPWLNSKWQSLAAAYMFSRGQSGQWTGTGC